MSDFKNKVDTAIGVFDKLYAHETPYISNRELLITREVMEQFRRYQNETDPISRCLTEVEVEQLYKDRVEKGLIGD